MKEIYRASLGVVGRRYLSQTSMGAVLEDLSTFIVESDKSFRAKVEEGRRQGVAEDSGRGRSGSVGVKRGEAQGIRTKRRRRNERAQNFPRILS